MVMFYECMGLEFVLLHVIQGSLSVLRFVRAGKTRCLVGLAYVLGIVAGGPLAFLIWSSNHIVQYNM
jgi:hypothetical protein